MKPTMLSRLSDLRDYKVAESDVDPRGWALVTSSGQRLGTVDGLLADVEALEVRYLETEVDTSLAGATQGRRALIPVEHVHFDERESRVVLDAISADEFARLPAYTGLPLGYDPDAPFGAGRRSATFTPQR